MEELPNCKQLKTGGLQFPCSGHSIPPQHPWHGRIPNQGSWRKQTHSVHQASLLCCQQHPQYRYTQQTPFCHQVPLPNPRLRDSPSWVQVLCSYSLRVCTVGQDSANVIWRDLFTCHPTAINSVLNLSHLQELWSFTEICSTDLKPSALGSCISKDCYGNSSSSLIKIILHLVSSQKLRMNIREGMRKINYLNMGSHVNRRNNKW